MQCRWLGSYPALSCPSSLAILAFWARRFSRLMATCKRNRSVSCLQMTKAIASHLRPQISGQNVTGLAPQEGRHPSSPLLRPAEWSGGLHGCCVRSSPHPKYLSTTIIWTIYFAAETMAPNGAPDTIPDIKCNVKLYAEFLFCVCTLRMTRRQILRVAVHEHHITWHGMTAPLTHPPKKK